MSFTHIYRKVDLWETLQKCANTFNLTTTPANIITIVIDGCKSSELASWGAAAEGKWFPAFGDTYVEVDPNKLRKK